ncbi:MAG TPA: hypothetical protein VFI96_02780 [Longimicrobiaceae bacterium]|nr:hypothetical protein [Longimicrobiaceae bacterium]
MFKLFWHAAVFMLLTFIVYLISMAFVRAEEKKQARREAGRAERQ